MLWDLIRFLLALLKRKHHKYDAPVALHVKGK